MTDTKRIASRFDHLNQNQPSLALQWPSKVEQRSAPLP